jgi:diguanylate cyclase (GGDEF)-like protein
MSVGAPVAAGTSVDLEACAREPIHVPGAIQPHGYLLSLEGRDFRVVRASENIVDIAGGAGPGGILGLPLDRVVGLEPVAGLAGLLAGGEVEVSRPLKLRLSVGGEDRPFDAVAHGVGPERVVELEPSLSDDRLPFSDFFHLVRASVARLHLADDVDALFEAAAAEIRRLTGYDRVMVYRFLDDWAGEVVGEARDQALTPYLGLRYPASDIPPQARRLYATNLLRVIPDVGYRPIAVATDRPDARPPLDMSRCGLRSVSPMHLEYLANMGVAATLCISLMVKGQLRGLIACHHGSPRRQAIERRIACEFLGQVLSLHWSVLEERAAYKYRIRANAMQELLVDQVMSCAELGARSRPVGGDRPRLLDLIDSTGAAVIAGGHCVRLGDAPAEQVIRAIVGRVAERGFGPLFITDWIDRDLPGLAVDAGVASGLIVAEVSRDRGEYLVWFRPEVVREVKWGGDPNKPVETSPDGVSRLHPRRSFELWREEVRGKCAPWTAPEIEAATGLRDLAARLGEERCAQARARQQSVLARLGQSALSRGDIGELMREAAATVASTIEADCCGIFLPDPEINALCLHAGVGWGPASVGSVALTLERRGAAERVMGPGEPEPYLIISGPADGLGPLLLDRGITASVFAPIRGSGPVAGVLGAHGVVQREFTPDEAGFVAGVAVILGNALARRRAEEALEHQALHDALTGLPNRTLFLRRVEQALRPSDQGPAVASILLIDLDRFKEVNDTYGHDHGDWLLQQIQPRLLSAIRNVDTVARLGGDEFAVLLPGANAADSASAAQRILLEVSRPFEVGGKRLQVGASIGVAATPEHGTDAGTLLRRADLAMYAAKRDGGGSVIFRDELQQDALCSPDMVSELRDAIDGGRLRLAYQPQVDLRTRTVTGAEALVRWSHSEHGPIPPDRFIPMAERVGLIRRLDRWVIRAGMQQCRRWTEEGRDLRVSVNVSARSLQDEPFADWIIETLAETGVAPSRMVLEVTESAVMGDLSRSLRNMQTIHDNGIHIAIDDFGTGYSSLSYLMRLPVDEVKIDRSFVGTMAAKEEAAMIVRLVTELGHNLKLRVVAEGVEDVETLERLAALGCDFAQGHLLGEPQPAEQLAEWCDRSREWRQTPCPTADYRSAIADEAGQGARHRTLRYDPPAGAARDAAGRP